MKNKVMVLHWLSTRPEHRYELFCEGTIRLSDVMHNPIVIAYLATNKAEIEILKKVGYVEKCETNEVSQDKVWEKYVQLDLSID